MINTFKLEEYLGQHEFKAPYLLCCSDAESISMAELLAMAAPSHRHMWDQLHLGYTEVTGLPQLKQAIADSIFPTFSPNQILCTAGAEDGIFCSLFALCEERDHVIVLTPCYQSLMEIPKLKGCDVTSIALREENQWRIDLNAIQNAIKANTKWVVINFPHNPTGQIISESELRQLINLLDKHGIWLFSDEAYRLLGPQNTLWAPPAACLYPKAISLGVMSKAFGMAGLRVGWVACQDQTALKKIEQMKHYTSICNSAPSEILSLIALANRKAILERNTLIIEENLKLLDQFFQTYNHTFSWVRPTGGCVGFVHYKGAQSIESFSQALLESEGVLLLPGSVYDVASNHFRIGFGRQNMNQALEKFERFLQLSRLI